MPPSKPSGCHRSPDGAEPVKTRAEMLVHAEEWIAAWNRRDLPAVLAAFAPQATFRSPRARGLTGSAFLEGKEAIADYWERGLEQLHQLQFTLIDVVCDEPRQSMVVLYEAELNGPPRRACEFFHFDGTTKFQPRPSMATEQIPPGFAAHFRKSPLTDPWEPLYSRRDGDLFLLGLHVREPHCNSRGLAHGGMISALADNAMGLACVHAAGREGAGAVTVNLSLDFLGAVSVGQWLQMTARPTKVGRNLAFAQAEITADAAVVARASAVFKMR